MSNKKRTEIQDAVVDALPAPCHGLLKLAPRVGKSRIAVRIIKNEKPESILWVTPSVKLRDIDIPREFEMWAAKRYLKKANIICYSSLADVQGHYDKVILDEYQDITPNNSLPFFNGSITYGSIIGLSGTHPTHIEKREIYRRLGLKKLAEIGIDDAVDLDLIADYQINVVEVDMNATDKVIEAGNKQNRFMTTEKAQYEYLHKMAQQAIYQNRKDVKFRVLARMRAVYDSMSKHKAAEFLIKHLEGRKLVFCGSIKQADALSPDSNYHSKTNNEDLQRFIKEESDLLTCVNAGGVGFTYRNVDHFIIIQANSDKKGDTTQKLARSLLKQSDYKAEVWILSLTGTQDEKWVQSALKNFDSKKVKFIRFKNLQAERELKEDTSHQDVKEVKVGSRTIKIK